LPYTAKMTQNTAIRIKFYAFFTHFPSALLRLKCLIRREFLSGQGIRTLDEACYRGLLLLFLAESRISKSEALLKAFLSYYIHFQPGFLFRQYEIKLYGEN